MTTKRTATIVSCYELVKFLRLGDGTFVEQSGTFFKTIKDIRVIMRGRRVPFVPLQKVADYKTDCKKKNALFYTIKPRFVALDENSETSGHVLSNRATICNLAFSRSKKKTTR